MNELVSKKKQTNEKSKTVPAKAGEQNRLVDILNMAIANPDVDVDKLSKLIDVHDRLQSDQARRAYNEAMAQFRSECPTIRKTRRVPVTKGGITASYAGLAETIDEIKPILSRHGLSHSWRTDQADGLITVQCIVTHVQGHSESTKLSAPAETSGSKNGIQAIASTVSYLERYTLFALLGLASAEMDDDGNMTGPNSMVSDSQMREIIELKDSIENMDSEQFKQWLIDAHGVENGSLKNLPSGKFTAIMNALKRRKAKETETNNND